MFCTSLLVTWNLLAKNQSECLMHIILLSVLRKILPICMLERINDKIDDNIPNSQAAYRGGRSATELVFTIKLMAEKITSSNYTVMLLMMDMCKAFDFIYRAFILEDLRSILLPEELHMIKLMIDDVKLAVKIGNEMGHPFNTNIGTPQGDCIHSILFTLYLANALRCRNSKTPTETMMQMKHRKLGLFICFLIQPLLAGDSCCCHRKAAMLQLFQFCHGQPGCQRTDCQLRKLL